MFAVSGLATILFFGGWNGPIPILDYWSIDHVAHPYLHYFVNFLGMVNFIGKSTVFVLVMIWVRWTLPRLRIDQVMKMCLKYCVPIAAVMFLGAVFWQYQFPGGLLLPQKPYGDRYVVTEADQPIPASADKTASLSASVAKGGKS